MLGVIDDGRRRIQDRFGGLGRSAIARRKRHQIRAPANFGPVGLLFTSESFACPERARPPSPPHESGYRGSGSECAILADLLDYVDTRERVDGSVSSAQDGTV